MSILWSVWSCNHNCEKIIMLMNIKMHITKHKKSSDLTVADLKRSFAHSFFIRAKVKTMAFVGRIKRFYRDYRLPSISTAAFLIIIMMFAAVRQLERTSLIALINEVSGGGNGYSLLLDDDATDMFTRNDTTETEQSSGNIPATETTQSTSNSFTSVSDSPTITTDVGTGGSGNGSGSNGGSSGNGGTTQPEPFEAELESFSEGSALLQCSNMSKPSKGSCTKLYSFIAGVKTLNGPGTVNYSWQSSIDAGDGNGSLSATTGLATTSVSKEIILSCSKESSFTILFSIISPAFYSSDTIDVNHNCNEI